MGRTWEGRATGPCDRLRGGADGTRCFWGQQDPLVSGTELFQDGVLSGKRAQGRNLVFCPQRGLEGSGQDHDHDQRTGTTGKSLGNH